MKKILCAVLAVAFSFALCFSYGCDKRSTSENPNNPDTPDNPDNPDDPGTIETVFSDYRVVYESDNAAAEDAADKIVQTVYDKTGYGMATVADSVPATDKEICVGAVEGRQYSEWLSRLPKESGWDISVLDDSVYIMSEAESGYAAAADAFEENFVLDESALTNGASVVSANSYRAQSAYVDDVPLSFYDIVYAETDTVAAEAAEELQTWFEENAGYDLPLRTADEADNEYNILINMVDMNGAQASDIGEEDCAVDFVESGIAISPGSADEIAHSVESFIAHFFRTEEADVRIEGSERITYKCWEYFDSDFEKTETVTTEEITEGVTYEHYIMQDADGNPVNVYALEAKAGGNWSARTAVADRYTKRNPVIANVLDTANQEKSKGQDVLFACNGGFFQNAFGDGLKLAEGVLIVDGERLSALGINGLGGADLGFFGVDAAGKCYVGDYSLLQTVCDDLQYAVGGCGVIHKDGKLNEIIYGRSDALGETDTHPRTCVGMRENGDLIFLVVDGRRPTYSKGMDLVDLGLLMQSYGVTDALNCDGGGSSTFVSKDADGTLSVKNQPSDGSLRSVGDCIVLVGA